MRGMGVCWSACLDEIPLREIYSQDKDLRDHPVNYRFIRYIASDRIGLTYHFVCGYTTSPVGRIDWILGF